jgi:O-antigen ligase
VTRAEAWGALAAPGRVREAPPPRAVPRHTLAAPAGRALPLLAAAGDGLDWLILLGTLALLAVAAVGGLTFMPTAGFTAHRGQLLVFEQAALALGAAGAVRRLLGGRALPGAPLLGCAAILVVCFLSLLHTTDLYATRDEVFFFMASAMLVLSLLVSLSDAMKTHAFVAGLVLITTGEAVFGLAQYARGAPTPAYWLSQAFAGVIHTRVYGSLGSPNVLAGFLLLGIAGASILAMAGGPGPRRRLSGAWRALPAAALAVQVCALVLTYSRGGYVGLIAFALTAAALLWPVWRRAWPVLLLIVLVAGAAAARLPAVGLRAESIAPAQEDTATSRLFIWTAGLAMWRAHRVWGTGLGTFNAAYSSYRPPGVLATYAMIPVPGSAHDDYLQVLAETGEAGAGLLVLAVLWALWRAGWRYARGGPDERAWLGAWGAALAGIGVTSVVDENLYVVTNVALLLALSAAVSAHVSLADRPPVRLGKRLLIVPLAAVLLALQPLLLVPVRAAALHREATREVHAKAYRQAVRTFQAALAVDPLNSVVPAYFGDLLADLYIRRIDSAAGPWRAMRARAAGMYELAVQRNPWYAYPHARLGELFRLERQYRAAAAELGEAVRLDPYTPLYRLALGRVLRAAGDRAGARAQLLEATRLYPLELLVIERHEGRGARYAAALAHLREAQRELAATGR